MWSDCVLLFLKYYNGSKGYFKTNKTQSETEGSRIKKTIGS